MMTIEETERNKMMIEIMALAYLVQVHTDYAVFIRYSGHIDNLEIEIVESADRYQNKIASSEFYTEKYHQDDLGWWKAKRDHLLKIIETGDVDVSEMNETLETIATYDF